MCEKLPAYWRKLLLLIRRRYATTSETDDDETDDDETDDDETDDDETKDGETSAFRRIISVFVLLVALTIFYTLAFPFLFANFAANDLQSASYKPLTSVQYRATSGSNEQTTEKGLRVIGTTQNFVFFYDRKESRTLIIPSAQMVEMKRPVTKD